MDLSIIIINWKSREFLRACLKSVYSNVTGIEFEVVVVDNASFDGCDEVLGNEYSGARFFQSQANLGFSGANNFAFARATGKYLLFLNPDTEIEGQSIQRMYEALRTTSDAGAVGARLLNSDRSLQTSCIQAFPTIANQALDAEALRARFPRWSLWGTRPLFDGTKTPEPVDMISGACIMTSRAVFEQVGGFSERYFMYAEDVDLCCRIAQLGRRCYYVPDTTVIHHGGQSSVSASKRDFAAITMRESLFRFLEFSRGAGYAAAYRFTTGGMALLRVLILGAQGSDAVHKWKSIFRWAIGLERPVAVAEGNAADGAAAALTSDK